MNDQTTESGDREPTYWWRADVPPDAAPACAAPALRPGDLCPACGRAALAYDPQFVLACPSCGHAIAAGAFT